ncbi:MAG: type II secretion system F family protein, partial [Sedimentisphaerales bacterium]|nr:type II secretion system F family protein [Sedimentisphaerales bacterium]
MATGLTATRPRSPWDTRPTTYHVSRRHLCILTRELAGLLRSGMPLVSALSAIHEQLECGGKALGRSKDLRGLVGELAGAVNAGWSLSDAMARHPEVFEPAFVAVVAAGEA